MDTLFSVMNTLLRPCSECWAHGHVPVHRNGHTHGVILLVHPRVVQLLPDLRVGHSVTSLSMVLEAPKSAMDTLHASSPIVGHSVTPLSMVLETPKV